MNTFLIREIRRKAAEGIHGIHRGVAGSATATTVIDTTYRTEADNNYFVGCDLIFPDATVDTQSFIRTISAYNGTSKTLTFGPATISGLTGATYEIYRPWRVNVYDNAIEEAISRVSRFNLVDVVDTSLLLVLDQYEYSVPASFNSISGVEVYSSALKMYKELRPKIHWSVLPDPTTPKLIISSAAFQWAAAGAVIRLTGQAEPALLRAESDTNWKTFLTGQTAILDSYIVPFVKAEVLMSTSWGPRDGDGSMQRAQMYQTEAEVVRMRSYANVAVRANAVRVRP